MNGVWDVSCFVGNNFEKEELLMHGCLRFPPSIVFFRHVLKDLARKAVSSLVVLARVPGAGVSRHLE